MENKNILICLEKMDIGGVETAVLNYAIEMKRRGNNVFVLAQNGIYCDELLKNDIHYINFNFKIEEKFNIDKIKQIKELIEKEKITQVHIHQYPCMLTVCPACILNNTPYIIYIHTTVPHEAYEWFYEAYPIYKYTCKTFFENAQKILGISQKSIQNHIEYFNEKEDKKYMVLPNSLNFKKYTTNTQIKSLTNFLIISRFANEKMQHIINGIDLFIKYIKDNNIQNAKLDIIGNGQTKPEIKAYIENTG